MGQTMGPGVPPPPYPRRRSFVGPVILICIGVFFLLANLLPNFHAWQLLSRYWPVILIFVGLGKVWDFYVSRRYPDNPARSDISGIAIALVLLVLLLAFGMWHGNMGFVSSNEIHDTKSVELQGAKDVAADLNFPAGEFAIEGSSAKLMDADFRYKGAYNSPEVGYSVSDGHGRLTLSQKGDQPQFGANSDNWNVQFNNDVPLDLSLRIGAGHGNLRLAGMNVTHLSVHMGAGEMDLDLTGPRKQNLTGEIHGGVGQAKIRLPHDVGVRVHASGGIGSVNADGLMRQGNEYTNALYGKTPTSIELTVEGGIGEIDLNVDHNGEQGMM